MDNGFTGTGVALVTPFDKNLKVDYNALTRLVDHTLNQGVDYLVVQGTTGESVTVHESEKKKILEVINRHKKGKPVVFGIGSNDTQKVIDQFSIYDPKHYDAILSVCPYYNKPTQSGLVRHFSMIADKSPKPVILYNVPGRTSVNLTSESTIELSAHPNIIGIKEASGDFTQCIDIVNQSSDSFLLISGDDLLALPLISIGAKGLISVIANALPGEMSQVVRYGIAYKLEDAQKVLLQISDLCKLMFIEGNPAGVKAFLEVLNLCNRSVRPPLVEASEQLVNRINTAYRNLKK